ncbi:MAG: HU family DNA-binding protein [Rectinemataceae bacterium]|nr:HU family DNA-binding protein [Spirochaetaceae bacterium]
MPSAKPMTKVEVISALAKSTGFTKKDVAMFLEAYAKLAYTEVKKNKKFTLPGIAIMKIVKRKPKVGRNPATGETITIPARNVIKITVAKPCKDAVLGTGK